MSIRPSEVTTKLNQVPNLRAALYLRVSTGRQAENDLSIPDQRRQGLAYCEARGWQVVAEYVEAGASGMDDRRPELQRLMDVATSGGAPFDAVVVHSWSRFARDAFAMEFNIRRLRKHSIELFSITQESGKDTHSEMVRRLLAVFDEHQSIENGKHTLRAMQENARQGFWNGSRAPYGYCVIAAEQRGAKIKKKLAVDVVEAEIVRMIFRLFRQGDGTSGPMGVKAIVNWLNANGYRTRQGANWGIGPLYLILTRTTYKGMHRFNQKYWKTKQNKPEADVIGIPVEPIIDEVEFDAVQALLKAKNPKKIAPRVVTGPILLTGVATCAQCGGMMTIRTGKSGRYRYYTCGNAARMGKTACKGRSVPMAALDTLVTERVASQLLTMERVTTILSGLARRQAERHDDHRHRVDALRHKHHDADVRLGRLYQAIESGIADPTDETLKERIATVKAERESAKAALDRALSELNPENRVTDEKVASFVEVMRNNVINGEVAFRRAYLRSVIDRVEVDETEVRIIGRNAVLEGLVMGGGAAPAGVPSFVRKWRLRRDSNSRQTPLGPGCSIQLSYRGIRAAGRCQSARPGILGGRGGTRIPGLRIRNPALYPAQLRNLTTLALRTRAANFVFRCRSIHEFLESI